MWYDIKQVWRYQHQKDSDTCNGDVNNTQWVRDKYTARAQDYGPVGVLNSSGMTKEGPVFSLTGEEKQKQNIKHTQPKLSLLSLSLCPFYQNNETKQSSNRKHQRQQLCYEEEEDVKAQDK